MQEQKNLKKELRNRQNLSNYGRYSGIAFQMIVIILLGIFFGKKMDKWFETKNPIYTAIFSLLGVIISLYVVLKDLVRKK